MTTRIALKPHVAAFVRVHFSSDRYTSPRLIGTTAALVKLHLTPYPLERMEQLPQGMESVEIIMPGQYREAYLKATKAKELAKDIEAWYWDKAIAEVRRLIQDFDLTKDEAIKLFCNQHQITESMYPIGSFRRKMHRAGVKGTTVEDVEVTQRISYKLTNATAKQIARIRKSKNVPLRILAKHYNISPQQVKNITQKIYPNLSQNLTNNRQQMMIAY